MSLEDAQKMLGQPGGDQVVQKELLSKPPNITARRTYAAMHAPGGLKGFIGQSKPCIEFEGGHNAWESVIEIQVDPDDPLVAVARASPMGSFMIVRQNLVHKNYVLYPFLLNVLTQTWTEVPSNHWIEWFQIPSTLAAIQDPHWEYWDYPVACALKTEEDADLTFGFAFPTRGAKALKAPFGFVSHNGAQHPNSVGMTFKMASEPTGSYTYKYLCTHCKGPADPWDPRPPDVLGEPGRGPTDSPREEGLTPKPSGGGQRE